MGDLVVVAERALTLRQPWAWLVVHGGKLIENRSWNTKFRGRFFIHTSKVHQRGDFERAVEVCRALGHYLPPFGSDCYQCGGIIGEATIVDVLPRWHSARDWKFEGKYGFVLEDRRPTQFVPCAGALNFWRLPEAVAAQLTV